MESLIEWIELIEDVRQQSKVRHSLVDIIVIVLFAMLANANEWEEIAFFAEAHEEYLKKYIKLDNGVPSHDTIRRVMGMINPEYLQQLQNKWNELISSNEGEALKKIINIDGKTMRSSKQKDKKPHHVVSAWSKDDGFCLGQKVVEEKSNEITAIPKLLDQINIKGYIITIDAMGTQTAIAEKIKENKGDYVLAVKENQKNLYENIKEYFFDDEFKSKIKKGGAYFKTVEKAHGQIETREYYQTKFISWMEEKSNWKGLKTIGMVQKTIQKENDIVIENRYYISSMAENIELFARAVRQHWAIESMHWHLDVTFREDYNTTIDKVAALNQNIIRKWCLAILKLIEIRKQKTSLKLKRFGISCNPAKYLEKILEI